MRPPIAGALVCLVAGVLLAGSAVCVLPCSVQAQPRSARFELAGAEERPDLSAGEALNVAVHLTGIPSGDDSVVALVEGDWFGRRLVSLAPASIPDTLSTVITLTPHPMDTPGALPKTLRIEVTFARVRGMALERFFHRAFYVTQGILPDHEVQVTAQSPSRGAGSEEHPVHAREPRPSPDQVLPAGLPLLDDDIHEEDLLARALPTHAETYWEELTRRVGRSWNHRAGQAQRNRSPNPVLVRFRLYPDGLAQLIQIERSSGSAEFDDAGMRAIIQALPFPPFPAELGSSPLELHVELQGGVRASIQSLGLAPPTVDVGRAGLDPQVGTQ